MTTFVKMLKSLTALCLLIALISSNFSRLFISAAFNINRSYIVENLCINKGKPWLHCDGKCYFMQKIRQAEQNEKKQQNTNQKSRYQESSPVVQIYLRTLFPQNLIHNYGFYSILQTVERSYAILLPPKLTQS